MALPSKNNKPNQTLIKYIEANIIELGIMESEKPDLFLLSDCATFLTNFGYQESFRSQATRVQWVRKKCYEALISLNSVQI